MLSIAIRLTKSEITLRVKAHDFLFGYEDNLLKAATGVKKLLEMDVPIYDKIGILSIVSILKIKIIKNPFFI